MPKLVRSVEEFRKLFADTDEIRVVRRDNVVKLKLRSQRTIYTYISNNEEADSLLKEIKVSSVEF